MDSTLTAVMASQASFALHLSTHLISLFGSANSNLTFSPLSIHSVLGLLTAGSTGMTQQQLLSFLGSSAASDLAVLYSQISNYVLVDGSDAGGPRLCYAGGVWADANIDLKNSFREVAGSVYKAEAHPVPFRLMPEECRKQINKWVEEVTAGHIKDLFPAGSITTDTRVVLGNAVYFKGSWPWDSKFDPRDTKTDKFYSIDGSNSTETLFMTSTKKRFVSAYNGFKVLKLPYEKGQDWRQFSFYIFLPDRFNGLPDLSMRLSNEPDFINCHIPWTTVPVRNFRIPKFKISTEIDLKETVQRLGLVLPFQATGDFSAMVDNSLPEVDRYHVSEIVHKCFVDINEEGTEAAAASGVVIEPQCARMPVDFVADHPFLFLIREDKTGVVLFAGHLLNPSMAE